MRAPVELMRSQRVVERDRAVDLAVEQRTSQMGGLRAFAGSLL
jgi:hypothetical protein